MFRFAFTLILLLFSVNVAFAADVCEKIAEDSCSTASGTDVTGTTRGRTNDLEDMDQAIAAAKPVVQHHFLQQLQNSDFRKRAIAVFGSAVPQCAEPNAESESCKQGLADLLADVMRVQQAMDPAKISALVGPLKVSASTMYGFFDRDEYKAVLAKTSAYLDRKTGQTEKLTRIQNEFFPRVIKLFEERIERLEISKAQKKRMLDRIHQVTVYDCTVKEDDMFSMYEINAFFEGPYNIRMCRGFLNHTDSEFSIIRTLAHELGHSVTPCTMGEAFPLPELTKCLRSKASIGAKKIVDPEKECHDKDQIGESTADWFSSEILPAYFEKHHPGLTAAQYADGYANSVRLDGCIDTGDRFDPHPKTPRRAGAVLLTQPRIREQLGCKTELKYGYCDSNFPKPFFLTGNSGRARDTGDDDSDSPAGAQRSTGGSGVGIGN